MAEYLIIDGYNIINHWPDLSDMLNQSLETARNGLIDIFTEYGGYLGINIVIVFDAHYKKAPSLKERVKGIDVVYTGEGQTADQYIENLVYKLAKKNRVFVATSDRVEQQVVMGAGAIRVSARELYEDVKSMKGEIKSKYLNKQKDNNTTRLENRIKRETFRILEKWRTQKE